MEKNKYIRKAAIKLYLKYIFFLVVILASGLYYMTERKRERVEIIIKNDMTKKSHTLKNTLKSDLIKSLRWISIYENVGIFEKINYSEEESPEIGDHEAFIEQLGVRNKNIDSVFLMDLNGEVLKKYYTTETEKDRELSLSSGNLESLKILEKGTLFVDKKSFGQNKASFNFYLPIHNGEEVSSFIGTSYNIDQFFKDFKDEFKGVFDTKSLGVLSREGNSDEKKFFSMDGEIVDIAEVTSARYKVEIPFNLVDEMAVDLQSYFSMIEKSDVFSTNGVLYSHINEEKVRKMILKETSKYIVFTIILFMATSLLLWLYIQEKVERISKYKEIQIYNLKLKKTLEMKDMLFSIIGHDLRSPFTSLLGYFQMIDRKFDKYDKDQIKVMLDTMSVSCNKLSTLTDNILRWSVIHNKKMSYNPENIDLKEMIREYEEVFKVQLNSKQLNLKIDISERIKVVSDKNLLEGSLRNLISNAIKFSRAGGTINVLAEERNNYILLSVEDNGVGIPEDIKPNLLKGSYITTLGTGNEKGMGLGLYIAKELSKLNKGGLSFESTQGIGTRFTISIPKI